LLIAGSVYVNKQDNTLVVRLNRNGTPDQSFGAGGATIVDQGQSSPTGSYSDAYFIQARPDGTALLVGDASDTIKHQDEQLLLEELTIDQPPAAAFTARTGRVGQRVRFKATGSTDIDGGIISWRWSFGDRRIAKGAVVMHSFGKAGTYRVNLTVTDDYGLSSRVVESVVVRSRRPAGRHSHRVR
jgi:PKD repeat protein